jgi:hypothetical protein
MSFADDGPQPATKPMVRIVRLSLTLLAIIVVIAFATGVWAGHFADGNRAWSTAFAATMALLAVVGGALFIPAFRDLQALSGEVQHLPRRERATVKFIAGALLLGLIGGLVGGLSSSYSSWFVGEARDLPPAIAIGLVVLLATVSPWVTLRWWRAIDEHEQAAYTEGANISGHFILFAGIGWWVLSRAGLVPDPDAMALIIAMSFVWTGVWIYRKFN